MPPSSMASERAVIATVLAGVALTLAIFGMLGENQTAMMGHASLAASHFGGLSGSHVPGLAALGLSATSFLLTWDRKSYVVAGLLTIAGIFYTIHLTPFMGDHGVIAFPGPVVGLFIGHVILALGVAAGIRSARNTIVQSPNK